jgi:hypothetical protein
MTGSFLLGERLLCKLAVHFPDWSADAGKIGTHPVDAKRHAAFRARDPVLPGLGLKPAHAAGVVTPKLAVGPGSAQCFGGRPSVFVDAHDKLLSASENMIKKFFIMNEILM